MPAATHIQYLLKAGDRRRFIDGCVEVLKPHRDKFKYVAITGYSGALIGGPVADRLDKEIIICRKNTLTSHGHRYVESSAGWAEDFSDKFVIIDDFICEGETLKRVTKELGIADCYGYLQYYVFRDVDPVCSNIDDQKECMRQFAGKYGYDVPLLLPVVEGI
jgi:hypothetical protein